MITNYTIEITYNRTQALKDMRTVNPFWQDATTPLPSTGEMQQRLLTFLQSSEGLADGEWFPGISVKRVTISIPEEAQKWIHTNHRATEFEEESVVQRLVGQIMFYITRKISHPAMDNPDPDGRWIFVETAPLYDRYNRTEVARYVFPFDAEQEFAETFDQLYYGTDDQLMAVQIAGVL